MNEWQPIESAPEYQAVWVFAPDCDPQQFVASLIHRDPSVGGYYWHPAEELVADALDAELCPTHWMPLPEPPKDQP